MQSSECIRTVSAFYETANEKKRIKQHTSAASMCCVCTMHLIFYMILKYRERYDAAGAGAAAAVTVAAVNIILCAKYTFS